MSLRLMPLAVTAVIALGSVVVKAAAVISTGPMCEPQRQEQPADLEFAKGTTPMSTPGLSAPVVLRRGQPAYTADALRAGIEGTAIVEAVIGADGTVLRTRIKRSLDSRFGLDQEALRAAERYLFKPATLARTPVAVLVDIALRFEL